MRTIPILIVLLVLLLLVGGRCDIDHAVRRDRTPPPDTSLESLPS